ncbi:hypothetical protein FQZ97_575540 [compost metagenome]
MLRSPRRARKLSYSFVPQDETPAPPASPPCRNWIQYAASEKSLNIANSTLKGNFAVALFLACSYCLRSLGSGQSFGLLRNFSAATRRLPSTTIQGFSSSSLEGMTPRVSKGLSPLAAISVASLYTFSPINPVLIHSYISLWECLSPCLAFSESSKTLLIEKFFFIAIRWSHFRVSTIAISKWLRGWLAMLLMLGVSLF